MSQILAIIPSEISAIMVFITLAAMVFAILKKACKLSLVLAAVAIVFLALCAPSITVQKQYGLGFKDGHFYIAPADIEYELSKEAIESVEIDNEQDEDSIITLYFKDEESPLSLTLPKWVGGILESIISGMDVPVNQQLVTE